MARPSIYTEEIAEQIFHRLVEGESLRSICRDESMPGKTTFFDWVDQNESFRTKYARAKMIQGELNFDYLQEIADDGTNDWIQSFDKDGKASWRENSEAISRSKLRAETMKWRIMKLLPKKYGEKLDLTSAGGALPAAVTYIIQKAEAAKIEEKLDQEV